MSKLHYWIILCVCSAYVSLLRLDSLHEYTHIKLSSHPIMVMLESVKCLNEHRLDTHLTDNMPSKLMLP